MTETDDAGVPQTFPVSEGARRLGVTEDWYLRQLRAKKLPGHKIGRTWRLTDSDVLQALDLTYQPADPVLPDAWGLTPTSRRRLNRALPRRRPDI
ncbi:excisionase family DNA-binding protein [Rhodococcus opacus]|uniref:excisionase family DNA-binding protein n=1 Tax=Rhodococcus opacus TaxID=37919 RepID=UPI0024B8D68C|nr:excisionase family DNA-binding protein [Rhodococcus opacus]MDJ0413813.1 excisionase family DNA-binding protein [Rhodococcus opacus]